MFREPHFPHWENTLCRALTPLHFRGGSGFCNVAALASKAIGEASAGLGRDANSDWLPNHKGENVPLILLLCEVRQLDFAFFSLDLCGQGLVVKRG